MTAVAYTFCGFRLGIAERELSRAGAPVLMPARVFELLVHLLEHRDRAVGRDELVQAVFGRMNVSDGQLSQIVLRARRCLGDDGKEQRMIRTVPRFGFRWVAEVEVHVSDAGALREEPRVDRAAGPDAMAAPDGPGPDGAALSAGPCVPASRPSPRHRALGVLALCALLMAVGGGFAWIRGWGGGSHEPHAGVPSAIPESSVLVLPARVAGSAQVEWARLGLMDLVAKRLRGSGLPVPESENTLLLVAGLEPDAVLQELASRDDSGGVSVVHVQAHAQDDSWRVEIGISGLSGDGPMATAIQDNLISAAHAAVDDLLLKLGRPPGEVPLDLPLEERLQRATSAMYANELEHARDLLADAPQLDATHPVLRYQLAQIDFRQGRFEEGARRLGELLMDPAVGAGLLLHVQVLNSLGAMQIRMGRYAEAEVLFDQAVDASRVPGVPSEAGRALLGRGLARALQGRTDPGLVDLGRARVLMQQAGDVIAVARVDANLGTVELVRNRPSNAVRHFEKVRDVYAEHGVINEWVVANTELSGARLALLETDEAWAANEQAWNVRQRISDPGQLHRVMLDRVEILMRRGHFTQAAQLMQGLPREDVSGMAALRQQVVMVELTTLRGEPRLALAMADRLMGEHQSDQRPFVELEAWLRWRRQQAALAAGALQPARLPAAPSAANDPRARVADRLAMAMDKRFAGDVEAADALFQEAVRLADQDGVPRDLVEAVAAWVPWLIQRGELDRAGALAGRVAPWAEVDFEAAHVLWLLYRAEGGPGLEARAGGVAQRLAGERRVSDGGG